MLLLLHSNDDQGLDGWLKTNQVEGARQQTALVWQLEKTKVLKWQRERADMLARLIAANGKTQKKTAVKILNNENE